MDIVIFLYHIQNLSLLAGAVGAVSSCVYQLPNPGIVYTILLAGLCRYFTYRWQKSPARILLLLLLIPGWFFCSLPIDYFLFGAVVLYTAVQSYRPFYLDYIMLKDSLGKQLRPWIGMLLLAPGFTNLSRFLPTLATIALLYAISTVYAMRMLRVGKELLESKEFKLINLRSFVGVGAGVAILSNTATQGVMGELLRGFYFGVVVPVLQVPLFLAAYVIGTVFNVKPMALPEEEEAVLMFDQTETMRELKKLFSGSVVKISMEQLQQVVWVLLGILITMLVLYFIFKKNLVKVDVDEEQTYVKIETQRTQGKGIGNILQRFAPKNHNEQIRQLYRKLMKQCVKKSIPITPFMDSTQISRAAGDTPSVQALRKEYAMARYGQVVCSKEDVQRAKDLYSQIQVQQSLEREED